MKKFSIIVATDEKLGIGKNNDLPWKIPSDMKFFTKTTKACEDGKQNAVVMGRKTWESIPEKFRPLPGRKNFILSSQKKFLDGKNFFNDSEIFSDFDFLLKEISVDKKYENIDKIFVIGGGQIYSKLISHKNCEKIYLTKVLGDFNCDSFFPEIPENFKLKKQSKVFEENGIKFIFEELEKK